MTNIPDHIAPFWADFLQSCPEPVTAKENFYESFRIGDTDEDADYGAELIVSGKKTTTSSLYLEYLDAKKALPEVGSLSVVEDGQWRPVAVVATTLISVVPFAQVSEEFARDYGETDGTLKEWRQLFLEYYGDKYGKMDDETLVVCERFKVLYPALPAP